MYLERFVSGTLNGMGVSEVGALDIEDGSRIESWKVGVMAWGKIRR